MSKIALKDVIHYYIGQRINKHPDDVTYPLIKGIVGDRVIVSEYQFRTPNCDKIFTRLEMYQYIGFIKPILRRLEDMTEDEAKELVMLRAEHLYGHSPEDRVYETYLNTFGQIVVSWGPGFKEKNTPQSKECFYPVEYHWLTSKGFDLFGLIESGQAVDTKILNP